MSRWTSDQPLTKTQGNSTYVSHVAPPTGVSATDTANITAAIAALPSTGGELRFPAGTYVTTGGFTLAVPTAVIGVGMGAWGNGEGSGSTDTLTNITCTSAAAVLFTVTATVARFEHISLVNTAGSTPTAGAGIKVTSALVTQCVDYASVRVFGFYDCVSVEVGVGWTMRGCRLVAPVRYALRIRNIVNPDAGDWSVSDSTFWSSKYDSAAGIRIDSSGGGKITNCKVNAGSSPHLFLHGIDISYSAPSASGDYAISNCSIENVSGNGINATTTAGSSLTNITITGCQINPLGTNTTGSPISFAPQAYGQMLYVAIAGCVLASNGAVPSIVLGQTDGVRIAACFRGGANTVLYSTLVGNPNLNCDEDVSKATGTAIAGTGWVAPALTGSWANFGSGYAPAGYRKSADGTVYLRGLIKSGNLGVAVFTLPVGFRPPVAVGISTFNCYSANGIAGVSVDPNGIVQVNAYLAPGSNGNVALDQIFFSVNP